MAAKSITDDRVAERLGAQGPLAQRSLALWHALVAAFDEGGPAGVKAMVEAEVRTITGRAGAAGQPGGDLDRDASPANPAR